MLDRLSLQPSEVNNLPWYEFLHYRNKLAEKIKAENDANKKQMQDQEQSRSKSASSRFRMPKMKKFW
ncbi:hypothetical protein [Tenacibaculum phage PTm5]|uniref:Uncharacterized protein n=1 Tax=Tenacibaculum phage PTm5 TaxID=2547426 RepID=A0A5S9HXM8_9CAUD|nr:hypothetical protein [Tenacibaculum phage PTm5]